MSNTFSTQAQLNLLIQKPWNIHWEAGAHPTLQCACSRIPLCLTELLNWAWRTYPYTKACARYHFIWTYFYGGTSKAKVYASHISGLAMLWACIFDVDAMLLLSWQKKYGKKMSTNLTQFIPQKIRGWNLLNCANHFYSWHAKKFYELPILMLKLYSFNCYSFLTAAVWNGESFTRTACITPLLYTNATSEGQLNCSKYIS